MAKRTRQRSVRNIPDKAQRAWKQLLHDLANDLGALKLLLAAVGRADDEERSLHLAAAKRTLVEGETRLQLLREAVRRELGESSSTSTGRQRSKRAAKSAARPIKQRST